MGSLLQTNDGLRSTGFFGQWSGNGPVSYFYPAMLAGAGFTGEHHRLLLQGMQNLVSFSGAIVGAIFTDKWGRRPQLLVSTGACIIGFALITALNATNVMETGADGETVVRSAGQAKLEIAVIFLFGFIYSAGYSPLQALYPVECLRYEQRGKGMGMYNFCVNIAGL